VAQQNMGFLYENGWGVPRDNAQAIAWYRFAARGHGRAKEEADRLASLMTPAELTKSVELLNELEAKGGRRDEESV